MEIVAPLIVKAFQMGLSLSVAGDDLSVTGKHSPAAEALVADMAPHKAAIIKALTPSPGKRLALRTYLGHPGDPLFGATLLVEVDDHD